MNKKALIIGGGAVALVAIIVALIFIFVGGEDAYRSIKVFEIDGSCKVERNGDSLDAFKNMALSSGDSLTVGEGSFARLKLDDDKYVYLEANTKINLTATGTANDSKTMVYIERGSMLTEVKKKLSATSSYDIVTPNTTMSIRGTKTLTEVVEDVVTGHVQTSNAVLEGQVKIKAVKVKADGTVVSVERDLGAGEGNAFKSTKEELVSREEMQAIAETGASVSGIKIEIVSEEDAGVVFDVATFDATFLESVKSILIADAEAAAGEEGLSQEEIDTINAQMDEAVKSLDAIREESQNAIDATTETDGSSDPEPEVTPQTTADLTPSPAPDFTYVAEDNDTQDEDTTLIEGNTSLVEMVGDAGNATGTVGENNDTDNEADADDNTDEDGADENDADDNIGEDGADEAEADNDDTDEAEADNDDTDEVDADNADEEDGEEDADEEVDDFEEEEEESEEERLAREEAERLEREALEEAERIAREETERIAREEAERDEGQPQGDNVGDSGPSGSGSEPGTQTITNSVSYNDITTAISFAPDSQAPASNYNVRVAFLQNSASSSGSSGSDAIPMSSLPTAPEQGSILPGYPGSSYSAIVVPESESVDSDLAGSISSLYSFTGWYASEADAASNDLSKRITTYSSNSANNLYPGISRVCSVVFMNYNEGYGSLVIPSSLPENIVTMDEYENDVVVMKVLPGTTITLPGAESNPSASDHPYISMNSAAGVNTSFYCYTTDYSADVSGQYYAEGRPSVYEETRFYFPSDTITVSENDDFLMLYMQFISPVEIRVRTNGENITVRDNASLQEDARTLAALSDTNGIAQALPTSINNSSIIPQKWMISHVESGNYDYLLQTVYYGNAFTVPVFENGTGAGYHKEMLCSYRTSANGLVTTYNNTTESDLVMFSTSNTQCKNPCSAADRDGKYVFTVQCVDWVYIDMNPANAPSGASGKCYKVGENHPYVIPRAAAESDHLYKFAVNPVDLYSIGSGQATFPFNYSMIPSGLSMTDNTKFIYGPDDIMYPYYKAGNTRANDIGTDPESVYLSSVIPENMRKSYAYVGAENYKLVGYKVNQNSTNYTILLNETEGYSSGGYRYTDLPCVITGPAGTPGVGESVMNVIDITGVGAIVGNLQWTFSEPIKLTPLFAPVTQFTASFRYENASGSDSAGFYLVFDNIDASAIKRIRLGNGESDNHTATGTNHGLALSCRKTPSSGNYYDLNDLLGELRSTGDGSYILYDQNNDAELNAGKSYSVQNVNGSTQLKIPLYDVVYKGLYLTGSDVNNSNLDVWDLIWVGDDGSSFTKPSRKISSYIRYSLMDSPAAGFADIGMVGGPLSDQSQGYRPSYNPVALNCENRYAIFWTNDNPSATTDISTILDYIGVNLTGRTIESVTFGSTSKLKVLESLSTQKPDKIELAEVNNKFTDTETMTVVLDNGATYTIRISLY